MNSAGGAANSAGGTAGSATNAGSGGQIGMGGNGSGGGATGGSTTGGSTTGGSATGGQAGAQACVMAADPMPTGNSIDLTPPQTIEQALQGAAAGDRIVLHSGNYTLENLSDVSFADYVFVEAAAGETVTIPGINFV
ncbi:MAG TPA: hypothetical protein VL137_04925, partial [Polyangiaceae bacterium]|nr:hypothetical protein [Polyangiaceae bacterium]